MRPIVIVGAGHGGLQAAASLRAEGYGGEILLFGDETGLPYHRPPLSKAFMDHGDVERLNLRPDTFFAEQMIDYRAGTRISSIDRQSRAVWTETGERVAYDHLILATGSLPYCPPIPGATMPGIVSLRRLDEAVALRAKLAPGKKAVVLGAGFIGLEFAAMASHKGLQVTVIEAGARVLARAVSAPMSDALLEQHRAYGVDFHIGCSVATILPGPDGTAGGVVLGDDTTLEADILLMATGARPNIALAEKAGLAVTNGITVDQYLSTTDPHISALGDCASFPDPHGTGHIRLECVQAANDHARCIASRLADRLEPYRALPWFWSDQADMKLQIAGYDARQALSETDLHWKILGDQRFIACRFEHGRLKAVETLNAPAQHMAARKLLTSQDPPSRSDVLTADGDLQALLRRQAAA